MTQTIGINSDMDMILDANGNLVMRTEQDAMADICKGAMQAQIGEMIFASDQGMPMMATAFRNYNPFQFEAAGRVTLLAVDGVLGVESFTVIRVGNTLEYTAVINTIYGLVTING